MCILTGKQKSDNVVTEETNYVEESYRVGNQQFAGCL